MSVVTRVCQQQVPARRRPKTFVGTGGLVCLCYECDLAPRSAPVVVSLGESGAHGGLPRAAGGKHRADGLWLSTMQAPYLLLDSVSVPLLHRIFFIGLMSLWRCLRKEREWMWSE